MSLLKTRDYMYDRPGPGQTDDPVERSRLVRQVNSEIPHCLEFRRTFYEPTDCTAILWSRQNWLIRLRRGNRRKQTHRLVDVRLYVLRAYNGIHRFGLSEDGTLYQQRSLRIDDKQNAHVWFRIDDVFDARASNDVLAIYLLWSLRDRDQQAIPYGAELREPH